MAAFGLWPIGIRTLVSMATNTTHRLTMDQKRTSSCLNPQGIEFYIILFVALYSNLLYKS